ncbi:hypothetical protein CC86DRAFT_388244 [Ophiobolus disseminans]|uniref:Uncharacterized protein n=1 Tax=Ophiobolus disseminans TaxID=1469910 RepID=A0A6A6ZEN9_9PLEO|nr:hypothetical protein CC86DRAFT_388244 [Ophiobolus disseminans]
MSPSLPLSPSLVTSSSSTRPSNGWKRRNTTTSCLARDTSIARLSARSCGLERDVDLDDALPLLRGTVLSVPFTAPIATSISTQQDRSQLVNLLPNKVLSTTCFPHILSNGKAE